MKRQFLTDLGIDSEQVDKIMREHGKTVNELKEQLEGVGQKDEQIKEYEKQLKERDKELEKVKEQLSSDSESQQIIKDLQKKNKELAEQYEKKLKEKEFDYALDKALTNNKSRNNKAVKALLDTESLSLNDKGEIEGLDKQLEALQESDKYLFDIEDEPKEPQEPNKPQFSQGQHQSSGGVDPFVAALGINNKE